MKTYIVVTNDEYELPVSGELVGAKAVAEFMCLPISTVNRYISVRVPRKSKYKPVLLQEKQNEDKQAYKRAYSKRYDMTHDRSEYFRKRYQKKKLKGA